MKPIVKNATELNFVSVNQIYFLKIELDVEIVEIKYLVVYNVNKKCLSNKNFQFALNVKKDIKWIFNQDIVLIVE